MTMTNMKTELVTEQTELVTGRRNSKYMFWKLQHGLKKALSFLVPDGFVKDDNAVVRASSG